MPNLAPGPIGSYNKLKPRRRATIRKRQDDIATLLVPVGLNQSLGEHNLLLRDSSQKYLADLPTVHFRRIPSFSEREDLLTEVVIKLVDRSVAAARVLPELLKDTGLLHGALSAADVEIETSSARIGLLGVALVDDVVLALPLEEGCQC